MQVVERRQAAALGAYPNPFNPATTLRYELPEAGEVRLTIYNTVGQAVRELVSGRQAAGGYAIVWDGRDRAGRAVASGLYVVRMEAMGGFQDRKITLLK